MIAGLERYPAKKDSAVPWLRTLPDHWGVERAKWLFRKMDRPVREADEVITCFRDGVVTLRKNRRIRGFTESFEETGYQGIRRGDLVIHAMDAFAGAVGVADADGKGTGVYSVCAPRSNADAHYYAYVIREMARSQWILALAKGIRERSTDFRYATFASQPVPVPPMAEQVAIARFLDHADRRIRRAIRAKQELIALLIEEKQGVIHRAVTRGFDLDVRLKPTGVEWLGQVPEHWEVLPLKRRWRVTDCKHLTVPFVEDGIPLASVREVQTFDLSLENAKRTTVESYEMLIEGGREPRRGDLIYCRNVSVGAAAIVATEERFAMGQDVCLIRSQSQNQRYLNYFLHSPAMERQLASLLIGSTFDRINVADIKNLIITVPPRSEQGAIADHLDRELTGVDAAIASARQQIELIREYRARLTADVVTGKLDVRNAAARLPDEAHGPELVDELDVEGAEESDIEAAPEPVEA